MIKDKKSLIIYTQPKKGITVHTKRDTLKIGLSIDERDKKDYFETRIKELEDANKELKNALNSLSAKTDEIKYLRQFRDLFTGHCITFNVRLTLLQCADRLRTGKCKMKFLCKTRLNILESIEV